jgi:hypothetical protein
MKHNPNKGNNKNPHHPTAKSCLPGTYTYHLTYRLSPKLGPTATAYPSTPTLVYGRTCIKERGHWFIRTKTLGVVDEVPRVADAPDL